MQRTASDLSVQRAAGGGQASGDGYFFTVVSINILTLKGYDNLNGFPSDTWCFSTSTRVTTLRITPRTSLFLAEIAQRTIQFS